MRIRAVPAVVLVAAIAAAGCGSRATPEEQAAARAALTGRQVTAGARSATVSGASDGAGATADAVGSAGTGTGDALAAGTGAPGGNEAASGGGAPGEAAAPAPAGGNGGATDVGVTGDTITLGNVSTLSGPVPGLFAGAVVGTQAFVAYQNSLGGVYGRKLKLEVRDDQLDAGQNRAQTGDLAGKVFAFLGSFSLYDDAGVPQMKAAGVPDVGYSLSTARRAFELNFSPQPGRPGWRLGGLKYYTQKFPDAVKAVATLAPDIPSALATHNDMKAAAESLGWRFVYERRFGATETDFTADVVRMRQAGAKAFYVVGMDVKGLARVAKAMQQQGFRPELFATGGIGYDPSLVTLAGSAVDGLINDQQQAMFDGEDAGAVPEVALMNQWMQKVKPGYKPDIFATFAWASGRLFVQALKDAGPKATRAGLLAALRKIDKFDANGLLAEGGPASKRPPTCYIVVQIKGGKYSRLDTPPSGFRCDGGFFAR